MTNPVFETARDAAIAGLQIAIPLARRDRWEYGGYVMYAPNGKFTYGDIVTSKDHHGVSLELAAPKDLRDKANAAEARAAALSPEESKKAIAEINELTRTVIIGAFHVHINEGIDDEGDVIGPSANYFSGRDLKSAGGAKWIAWLGLTSNGKVMEIDARTKESFLATTGERKTIADFNGMPKEMLLLGTIFGAFQDPPILASGIEVYAGDVQDAQQQAA